MHQQDTAYAKKDDETKKSMDRKSSKMINSLRPSKMILPVLLGLGVIGYILYTSSEELDFAYILSNIKNASPVWIGLAIIVLIIRDGGYIWRIRHLTNKELNWTSSFFVIVLWEFASAITPSVVGGTTLVVFIINKEGIPFGRALAYVMLTAVFDNIFFIIASILVFIFVPVSLFPQVATDFEVFGFKAPLQVAFGISVTLITLYTLLMAYGLFVRPRTFKWMLIRLTGNRLLKRFRRLAVQSGTDVITASEILREKSLKYWSKALGSTFLIWVARYFMLNCLIAAFTPIDVGNHFLIFARQIVMWIVMLISPTPGSAGTAEFMFPVFFGEFFAVAAFSSVVAIFWRLFTYYAYLGLGAFFLPRWVRRIFQTPKSS